MANEEKTVESTRRADIEAQRAILMYAFDVSVIQNMRSKGINPLDARGMLRTDVVDVDGVNRATYERGIMNILNNGGSIPATYQGTFREISEAAGRIPFDFSGSEIDSLPNSVSGTDEENEKIDNMIITLYDEYHTYGSIPVVPFDTPNGASMTNYARYDMHIDANDLADVMLYTSDGSEFYVRPVMNEDGEWTVDTPQSYIIPEAYDDFEKLLATEAVFEANEMVRLSEGNRDSLPLTLTQAQDLRKAISFNRSDVRTIEQARLVVIEKVDAFLHENNLVDYDESFADYLETTKNAGGVTDLADDESLNRLFDMAYKMSRPSAESKIHAVDVFGFSENGSAIAMQDSVHAYLNGNQDEQLSAVNAIREAHDEEILERLEDVDSIGINRFMFADDRYVYLSSDAVTIPEAPYDGNLARGFAVSDNDKYGLSRLRPYMKTSDYEKLSIEGPDDFNADYVDQSVDSAVAILDYLSKNGIAYTVEKDAKPTQIKAHLTDLGLDVRLIDVVEPNYVGRVYGDNLETYFSAALENGRDKTALAATRAKNLENPNMRVVNDKLVYIPTAEEAVNLLKYRLGETVMSPEDLNGVSHEVGAPGSYFRTSMNRNYRQPPANDDIALGSAGSSYTSSTNAMAQYKTVQSAYMMKDGRMGEATVPVSISTRIASTRSTKFVADADEAYAKLNEYLLEARSNFSHQVFDGIDAVMSLPTYKTDSWAAYVKTPRNEEEASWERDEKGYILNPETGERVVYRSRIDRRKDLLDEGNKDISTVQISHDPAVKELQQNYIDYIDNDDAMLRGLIDGHVTNESMKEFEDRFKGFMNETLQFEEDYEALSDEDKAIIDMIHTESYSKEEKTSQVKEHFDALSNDMFGEIDENGVMRINVSNIVKYGGYEERELFRLIQAAKGSHDIEFVSVDDSFTMNRLRENTATFDAETAKSLLEGDYLADKPMLSHFTETMLATFRTSGCEVKNLEIDDKGIVHYVVNRNNSDMAPAHGAGTKKQFAVTQIDGYIGQIVEPDEYGAIFKPYLSDRPVLVAGYNATIVPGSGSVESRTVLKGYEQQMDMLIKKCIRTDIASVPLAGETGDAHRGQVYASAPTDTLNCTELNGVYRHLNSSQYDKDCLTSLKERGMDEESAKIVIADAVRTVRYDSSLAEESTIRAIIAAKRSNIIDNMNMNGFSLTGRDISCLQMSEPGYFDPTETSGSTVQGLTRVLSVGAVPQANGFIQPTTDEKLMHAPMAELEIMKNGKYDPFDRQQMVYSNLKQMNQLVSSFNVAYTAVGGYTMEDGPIMTKKAAERYLHTTEDVEATKALTPEIIELSVTELYQNEIGRVVEFRGNEYQLQDTMLMQIESPDGSKTALVPLYEDVANEDSKYFGWSQVEGDVPRYYGAGEQIKAMLIEEGIGLTTIQEGDKICDGHGNKGVISAIIDPDMPDDVAEARGLKELRDLCRVNEDLDVVMAYPSSVSRFNAGTIRDAMFGTSDDISESKAKDLNLPDGSVIEGGIVGIPMILTDKTAEHKTKVYDDEDEVSKGRKASSQLAWVLEARGAHDVLASLYDDNASAWREIREKLLVLGCDIDENYNIHFGYEPHAKSDGTLEERPHMRLDTSKFGVTSATDTDKNGHEVYKISFNAAEKNDAINDLKAQIAASGGILELPFPLDLGPAGIKTQYDDASGKYLLHVLPVQYRSEQTYDDGSAIKHKYTRQYNDIVNAIAQYELDMMRYAERDRILAENPDAVIMGLPKSENVIDDSKSKAQAAYDAMKADIEPQFEGSNKHNIWRHSVMSHALAGRSATGVIRANPNLGLEDIQLNAKTAASLNLRDGDSALVWRDPLLRGEGVVTMKVHVSTENESQTEGFAIHPSSAKRLDGDFDGDTLALVNLRRSSLVERDFAEAYLGTEDENARKDIIKEFKAEHGAHKFSARRIDNIIKQYNADEALITSADTKLSFANTMVDLGTTPDKPKTIDDIHYALNEGLDVASGRAAAEEKAKAEGREYAVYATNIEASKFTELGAKLDGTYTKDGKTYGIVKAGDMEDIAKAATLKGDKRAAYEIMNSYIHESLANAYNSDYLQFGSYKDYFDRMNQIVVAHEVKGSLSKLEDLAAYLNIRQTPFDLENPNAPRLARTVDEQGREIIDTSVPFKDYGEPPINCTGKSGYWMETNGVRTHHDATVEHLEECQVIKADAEERYRQVELATAIKAFGTGTAGAFSQRGVKACREDCICDLLEITYGATQGLLQAKHSAIEAEQKFIILTDALPALWKGQLVKYNNETERFESVCDNTGKPVPANKKQWVDSYLELCEKKGLDFKIDRSRLETVADVLYEGNNSSNATMKVNVYRKDTGCNLDRVTYGGSIDTVYKLCEERASLLNTKGTEVFKPNDAIVSDIKTLKAAYQRDMSSVKKVHTPAKVLEPVKVEKNLTDYPIEDKTTVPSMGPDEQTKDVVTEQPRKVVEIPHKDVQQNISEIGIKNNNLRNVQKDDPDKQP